MARCGGDISRHPPSSRRAQQETIESLCQGLLDDVMVDDDKYRVTCGAFGYLQEWPDLSGVCYTGFGAPPGVALAQETSNGNSSFSCSGGGGGSRKRRPDAYLDAKGDSGNVCKGPRGKQQLCDLDQIAAGVGKGKQERPKPGAKRKAELALSKDSRAAAASTVTAGQKTDYIHVRARRGQATDSHSLAERVRRERISERMRYLQELVPGCNKVTGKAGMLDEIINYVQSLQKQVEFLSMKIAASNPVVNFNIVEDLFGRQLNQACNPAALSAMTPPIGQLEQSCLQMSSMQQMQPAACSPGFGLEMVLSNPYTPAPSGPISAATAVSVPAAAPIESCFNVNGAAAWDIESQNLFSGFDAQFQSVQSDCLLDNLKMEIMSGQAPEGEDGSDSYDPSKDSKRKLKSKDSEWKYAFWPTKDKDLVECSLCGKQVILLSCDALILLSYFMSLILCACLLMIWALLY